MINAAVRTLGSMHEYVITAARTEVLRAIKEIAGINIVKIVFRTDSSGHGI
jgi:hypothetical protein